MSTRANSLFAESLHSIHRRTDRLFAVLLGCEYFFGIAMAYFVSPLTWAGGESSVHIHVIAAVVLGGAIVSLPIGLAVFIPGATVTRHTIAVGQMLFSALLIHLMGGRPETHFHIFGSLAFLGFYRDWKVLVSASALVAADHFLRGRFWPQSVFGLLTPENWRWLEHVAWVVFEDIFIILATRQSLREMQENAERRAYVEQVARDRADDILELQRTREELNDAIRAKDTFISICGHELKTPLTAMGLQTQLTQRMIRQGKDVTPERLRRVMDQSDAQVKRLLRLVQDMLDHSRLQAGKMEIYCEQVELRQLVEEVAERCQSQAESTGAKICLDSGPPVWGNWDQFRLEQVVTNLLTNAIKYGEGKPIEVQVEGGASTARVVVRDHGVGIAPEHQAKVFQQYERVGETKHIAGLGLGLYITKGIVERHGGLIWVDSQSGLGSSFLVELPLHSQDSSVGRTESTADNAEPSLLHSAASPTPPPPIPLS